MSMSAESLPTIQATGRTLQGGELATFQKQLEAVPAVGRKVYTHGYSEIQVPPGDDGPALLRTGIELLAEGQDLEPALELLATLLRAGGTAFREDPANVLAVESCDAWRSVRGSISTVRWSM